MTVLTIDDVQAIWVSNGGADDWRKEAWAFIAYCESGFNTEAANWNDPCGGSFGLWQINGVHNFPSGVADPNWINLMYDANNNAKVAIQLSANGTNPQPWIGDPVGDWLLNHPGQIPTTAILESISGYHGPNPTEGNPPVPPTPPPEEPPFPPTVDDPEGKEIPPIVGGWHLPNGQGYYQVDAAGGVYAHGKAQVFGSIHTLKDKEGKPLKLEAPIVGMSGYDSNGYTLYGADGGVFCFGSNLYLGGA